MKKQHNNDFSTSFQIAGKY